VQGWGRLVVVVVVVMVCSSLWVAQLLALQRLDAGGQLLPGAGRQRLLLAPAAVAAMRRIVTWRRRRVQGWTPPTPATAEGPLPATAEGALLLGGT
jgi:hypothetical protein